MNEKALVIGPDKLGRHALCVGNQVVFFGAGDLPEVPADAAQLQCPDGLIEAGHVCAHTHLYSGLVPLGMPAPEEKPENFVQILERVWWRLDRALDTDTLRASARFYVAKALLTGTTSIVDHHESPNFIEGSLDVLADAFQELGARGMVCYGATDRNDGTDEGDRGLKECARFIKEDKYPLVKGLVGLHASFTVSDETVKKAAQICAETGAKMHVHVAEDAADVADAKKRGYKGPFQRMLEMKALPEGSIMAHGIHMNPAEIHDADQAGLWFVQNPQSNHGNEVGYAQNLRFAQKVALGTDGYPADMNGELAFLKEKNRLHNEPEAVAEARLYAGWRMMSDYFKAPIGPLTEIQNAEQAVVADLRILDADGKVLHTVVDGEIVVKDGALVNADFAAIEADAKVQAERLWAEMAKY